MNKPKFVIGIGSQRAGSTLLHKILDECTDIFMHPVKELHYFDTLYDVRHQDVLTKYSKRQLDRELDKLIESKEHGYLKSKKYKCYLRTNKILAANKVEDVDYLDLYRPCIMGNNTIGEITPEYMILPEEGIKKLAEVVGKDAHIILIARNPVQRFISAFKLLKAYNNQSVPNEEFDGELRSVLENSIKWVEQQDLLNDYKKAFKNYQKYFSNVLFLSYDNIIGEVDKTHGQLTRFLNLEIDKDRYTKMLGKRVNAIGETGSVSKNTLDVLTNKYKSQIEFLNDYFGISNCQK